MGEARKLHLGRMAGILIGKVQSAAWRRWGRRPQEEKPAPKGFVRTSSSGGLYR